MEYFVLAMLMLVMAIVMFFIGMFVGIINACDGKFIRRLSKLHLVTVEEDDDDYEDDTEIFIDEAKLGHAIAEGISEALNMRVEEDETKEKEESA